MKEKIKQAFKIILFIALSAVLLYLAFRKTDLREVIDELKHARYGWLILSLSFSILALISRARRWILIIRPLGYSPRLWNTYHALLTGYLVNFGIPRLGELTRCVALGKKEKIPVDRLFGTVIAERAFDFITLMIILLLMLVLRGDLISSFLGDYVWKPISSKLAGIFGFSPLAIIITALVMIIMAFMLYHYREGLKKNKLVLRIADALRGITNGLKAFVTMDNKPEFIFHTVFIWLNYTLMTWVIVFMIPATADLGLADGIFLLVVGSLGMAAPVQGGIGAFHWIVSRGLAVVYGIPLADGLVYATLSHESQMILVAILGTISFYMIYRKKQGAGSREQGVKRDVIPGEE